ncbi:MAG: monofunctional biosynthetic peptidoglycan transglycosylase [Melioribacteraceae bacterium]|nr:monofunctional biosynthetic peptidoglycan transglycosylase [Melioribacteraceae bacterium]MCF8412935.1 monofunctional biosynthetic peptidoglycan transglycosylase [Melioribacteraceae bacterium]
MKGFFASAQFVLYYTVITLLVLVVFRFIPPATTAFVMQKSGLSFPYLSFKENIKKDWIAMEKIAPTIPLAIIAAEDQKYFDHWGFDFQEIQNAVDEYQKKNRLRGASTISQQLAKNMFLSPNKNFIRKGFEAYFTFIIELAWDKKRIMEVYLNSIELGKDVYGVKSGSETFLNKSCSSLSRYSAAKLASLIPNPVSLIKNPNSSYMLKRAEWIEKQMSQIGGEEFIKANLY